MRTILGITIIALLTGMVGPIAKVRSDLKVLRTALASYRSVAGAFPSTAQGLKALLIRPEVEPKPVRWRRMLEAELRDPWQFEYIYKCPGEKNPDSYDLFSVGKDGKAGTDDDIWQ